MFGANPKRRAECYHAILRMYDAGIAIDANLEALNGVLSEADQSALNRMVQRIRKGAFLAKVMEIENMPPLDVALVAVGEKTGNLAEVLKFLVQFYEGRAAMERSFRRALSKPFFLFLMSVFMRDIPQLFTGKISVASYFLTNSLIVGAVLSVVVVLFNLYRASNRSRKVAENWHRSFSHLPWFGGVVRAIGKERFFTCLLMGLRSGCDLQTMVGIANDMTFLPSLHEATKTIASRTQSVGFAQAVTEARICTANELLALKTGEISGTLDGALKKITDDLRLDVEGAMRTIEEWLPRVFYALAVIYVVMGVFKSMSAHFKAMDQLLDKV